METDCIIILVSTESTCILYLSPIYFTFMLEQPICVSLLEMIAFSSVSLYGDITTNVNQFIMNELRTSIIVVTDIPCLCIIKPTYISSMDHMKLVT